MKNACAARLKSRKAGANRQSLASRWNIKILRALEAELKKHPEADISSLPPRDYSDALQACKTEGTPCQQRVDARWQAD
jgi:hypothetical protein